MGDSLAPDRTAYINAPLPIAPALRALFRDRTVRVVFDVGSCEGEDAIRYARFFPESVVYAFEPVPRNVELIRRNVERFGAANVRVLELALADEAGTVDLHLSEGRPDGAPPSDWDYGNKSSSLLSPSGHLEVHPWVRFDRSIRVTAETIDSFCDAEGLERIDFVHMDVQGAELRVLEGARRHLGVIAAIWLEVEAIPLYLGQPLRADVEAFMSRHGFRLLLSTVGQVSGDQLYYNASLVRPRRSFLDRVAGWARRRTRTDPT